MPLKNNKFSPCRQPFHAEYLPPFARLYVWAYNPAGRDVLSRMRRTFGQLLYRAWRKTGWGIGKGIFTYSIRNESIPIRFNAANTQFDSLYARQTRHGYELETSLALDALATDEKSFYDIGSNWGYFSLFLASKKNYTGKIFAFEPFPSTFDDLQSTIRQAGLTDRIQALPVALSDFDGESVMSLPDGFRSGLALLSSVDSVEQATVKVMRIDSFDLPPPAIIKLDVEGSEARVIRGGKRTIAKHKPHIVFEHYRFGTDFSYAIFDELSVLGYSFYIPVLQFKSGKDILRVTSGEDYGRFIERYGEYAFSLVPLRLENRCLLPGQLNILAVHRKNIKSIGKLIAGE